MAAYVWTGATNSNYSTGSNWKVGGVVQSVPPGASDDVFFGNGTGFTNASCTVDVSSNCKNLDCTGYTGTLTFTAQLNCNSTSLVKLVSTMSIAGTGNLQVSPATGTTTLMSFGGKTVSALNIFGVGTVQFQDASSVTNAVTLTQGTLDTNNQNGSWGSFTSTAANTRVLTLGSSQITITGNIGTHWVVSGAGVTISANTALLTFNTPNGPRYSNNSGPSANGLSIRYTRCDGQAQIDPGTGLKDVTFDQTSIPTSLVAQVFVNSTMAISGTLTIGGATVQGNKRLWITSASTHGTLRAITCAAVVINGDVNFSDIDIAYTGSPSWTNTGNAFIGDCGGNGSVITSHATASATQTWSGTSGGNWSANAWSGRVPLPQDDANISSAFTASQNITGDMLHLGRNISFAGSTGSPKFTNGVSGQEICGSLDMTGLISTSMPNGFSLVFAGRNSNFTIKTASVQWSGSTNTTINAPGATYSLADDYNGAANQRSFLVLAGTFDTNGKNMTINTFSTSGSFARTINFRTSTITITRATAGSLFSIAGSGMTFLADQATFVISSTDANTKNFDGFGQSYGTLQYNSTGTGTLVFTGNNTFVNLVLGGTAKTISNTAGARQKITGVFTGSGASGQTLSFVSGTPGTKTYYDITGTASINSFVSQSADVVFNFPRTETGTSTETANLRLTKSDSDSGTGLGSTTVRATLPRNDSGQGVESASPKLAFNLADTGTSKETFNRVGILTNFLFRRLTEAGFSRLLELVSNDRALEQPVLSGIEQGINFGENNTSKARLAASQTGAGSDQASEHVALSRSDAGVSNQASSLHAVPIPTDVLVYWVRDEWIEHGRGSESTRLIHTTSADLTVSYVVDHVIPSNLTPSYNVLTKAAAGLTPSYTVTTPTGSQLSPAYTVTNNVRANLTPTYNVVRFVGTNLAPTYNVLQIVGASLAPTYSIVGRIQANLSPIYTITTPRHFDFTATYTVTRNVSAVLTVTYDVDGPKPLIYAVITRAPHPEAEFDSLVATHVRELTNA